MPKVSGKKVVTTKSPEYVVTTKLLTEYMNLWRKQMAEAGVEQVLHTRLSVVALTQIASIAGVDVGMTTEQFLDVCKANFEKAYANAPKFG